MSEKATPTELAQDTIGLLSVLLPLMAPAAGPVGLGISAAVAIAPAVARRTARLAPGGGGPVGQQADRMAHLAAWLDFEKEAWTRPVTVPVPIQVPPVTVQVEVKSSLNPTSDDGK